MKTTLKAIMLLLLISTSFLFVYCHEDFENEDGPRIPTKIGVDKGCGGKKILKFNSLAELQQRHYTLSQQYIAGNEEEQILDNFENSMNFYSLRKKEQDMDAGILPYDPTFDETNYTFDPILETFLNKDGMIVIADRLYIWDSGCVIHSIPYTCQNYDKLLAFHNAALSGSTGAMHDIFINSKMKNHNICDDKNFDFEDISESGGKVKDGGVPKEKNKNNCGYEVVVNNTLASCAGGFYTYKISYTKQIPPGSTPFDLWYIKAVIGSSADIQISNALLGNYVAISLQNQDADYGYVVPYFEDFYLRVPIGTPATVCDITLLSTIASQSGGSCMASNTINVNNDCPFSIVANEIFVNETQSQWTYTINGTNNGCTLPGTKVTWNFGDGTSETGSFSATHNYSVPCAKQYITVTATIEGTVCNTPNKTFFKYNIPWGNPCTRDNYTFDTYKDGVINGKKVKERAKLKRNPFGKSVFVNVFKCRVLGDKHINSIGAIYEPTANNSGCVSSNIANVVGQSNTSGKKRNKQKEKFQNYYHINAMNPYSVQFTHSSGYSHTLSPNGLYCSQ